MSIDWTIERIEQFVVAYIEFGQVVSRQIQVAKVRAGFYAGRIAHIGPFSCIYISGAVDSYH